MGKRGKTDHGHAHVLRGSSATEEGREVVRLGVDEGGHDARPQARRIPRLGDVDQTDLLSK